MSSTLFKSETIVVFIGILVICSARVVGQDNKFKEIIPASPNAAALGKYGEIPVGYHTGVPQLSIPIHTVTEGDISVPISISYHASGIKVEDLSSWIGLGWSLNAGGVITRSVVGAPDEGSTRGGGSDVANTGWYKDGGMDIRLTDTPCPNPNGTSVSSLEESCLWRFQDAANGVADTEPDMFSFNFAGYSGKFFFNEFREAIMQPRQDIVIQPASDFKTWTITTSDGTKYSFGGISATELTYFGPTGGCCSESEISSTTWYLTRIENFNGTKWISFTYVPEKYSYTQRPSQSVVLTSAGVPPSNTDPNSSGFNPAIAPQYTSLVTIKGVRLLNIKTSSAFETVHFQADELRQDVSKYGFQALNTDEAKRLDKIVIENPIIERTFDFGYSYFESPAQSSQPGFGETTQDRFRLKLDYVQEKSGLDIKTPHRFYYNTDVTMARRLSLGRDHWGYYNGADGNTGLIPNFSVFGHDYNGLANRDVDEGKMKAWTINKIVYPTGGWTEFIFEAHRQNETSLVGGLRIKQIKTYDGLGSNPMVKTYSYDFGLLYAGNPNYVQGTTQHEYTSFPLPDLGILVTSNLRSSLRTTQGYHIGYSTVWVTDGVNGKSTYRFYNSVPGNDFYFPASPTQSELGMGELFQELHEDNNGVVLHYVTNYYVSDFTRTIRAKKVANVSCVDGCGSCGGLVYCGQYVLVRNYEIREGRRLLTIREEYRDGMTLSTNYFYSPNHNQPIKVVTKRSSGQEEQASFDYAKDRYVSTCSINDSDCRQTYFNALSVLRQQLNEGIAACEIFAAENCDQSSDWTFGDCQFSSSAFNPLASCRHNCELRKRTECIGSSQLISIYQDGLKQAEINYQNCRSSVFQSYNDCVESSINSLNAADKSLATMIVGNLNATLEEKTVVNLVQTKGSRTIYEFQNDLLLPSDFYSYNPQSNVWKSEYTVRYDEKGNVIQTKKDNDYPVTYLWGYNNTLPAAKVTNCDISQVEETQNVTLNLPTTQVTGLQSELYPLATGIPITFVQNVTLNCTVSRGNANPSIPDHYFNVIISLYNEDSQNVAYTGAFGLTTQSTHTVTNLPVGKYTIQYQYLGDIGNESFSFSSSFDHVRMNLFANAFYTGFEEDVLGVSEVAYTGRKSHIGSFILNLPRFIGTYTLSYKTKSGTQDWVYHTIPINVTSTAPQTTSIGSSGVLLDEVRLHPKNAKMTTYTYDPGIGMTSSTDPNCVTTYYEYDEFGRLSLLRDDDGNIIKHFKYHYKDEQ